MNKLLIFATCITPLLLFSADAKFSASNLDQSMEKSVEVSKPLDVKIDQYIRIKCNLPKISEQEIKNIANNAIDTITDIEQRISTDRITISLKNYCELKDKKGEYNSVFGKVIEIAQDLVVVAKTYADFDNVVMLEKISKNALNLYGREEVNFNALASNQMVPEYDKNEALFKRFIARDLMVLKRIVSQYGGKSMEDVGTIVQDNNVVPENGKDIVSPVLGTEGQGEKEQIRETGKSDLVGTENHSELSMDKNIEPSSSMTPASDKEITSDKDFALGNKDSDNSNIQSNSGEPVALASAIAENKEETQNIERAEEKPLDSENPREDNKVTMDMKPIPVDSESNAEILNEKPIDINSRTSVEESKEVASDKQKFIANSDMNPAQNSEVNALEDSSNNATESSQTVNNGGEENSLLPHYFSGKKSEPTKINEESQKTENSSTEQKDPSEERKSFWGF